MAGFQQAANAIVSAPGQIMRSTGIYNELVGKNQELIEEISGKNEELKKKNEDITEKNKTIRSQYEDLEKNNKELRSTNKMLNESMNMNYMMAKDYVRMGRMVGRVEDHERGVGSKYRMLSNLYDEEPNTTAGPTGNYHGYETLPTQQDLQEAIDLMNRVKSTKEGGK